MVRGFIERPVLGMLAGIAALTQGNLGTAFRHRDQVVWVLALCGAAELQWLVLQSRWARTRPSAPDATMTPAFRRPSSRAPGRLAG